MDESCGVRKARQPRLLKSRAGRRLAGRRPKARRKHSPYWATPQCVLGRHMAASFSELHIVGCTDARMRIVRP